MAANVYEAVEDILQSAGVLTHFVGGLMTGSATEGLELPRLTMLPVTESPDFRTNTSRYDRVVVQLASSATTFKKAERLAMIVEAAMDDALLYIDGQPQLHVAAGTKAPMEEVKFWKFVQDFTIYTHRPRFTAADTHGLRA